MFPTASRRRSKSVVRRSPRSIRTAGKCWPEDRRRRIAERRRMSSPLTAPITGLLVAVGFVAASLADSPRQARGTAPPQPAPQVQKVADTLRPHPPPQVQQPPPTWPPDAKPLESRRKSAEEVRLFARAEPLAITLSADFKAVMRDRDPKSTKTFPATISYPNEDGTTATIPLQIRTRGHSRLLRQT